MKEKLKIISIDGLFGICKLEKGTKIPRWAVTKDSLYSITKTADELSVVCPQHRIPYTIKAEKGWKALKIEGPLDFSLTGVLESILRPLANLKISVFVHSTYETDYLFIKQNQFDRVITELKKYFDVQ